MGVLDTYLQKKKSQTKTTTGVLDRFLFGKKEKQEFPKEDTRIEVPMGSTEIRLENGNRAFKTPSGGLIEILPDGNKIATFPKHLGGGSYNINTKNPSQVVKSERDYGGIEAQKGKQRDHIFPVSLGGASTADNIRLTKNNPAKLETQVAADVKSGDLPLGQARLKVLEAKQPKKSLFNKVADLSESFLEGLTINYDAVYKAVDAVTTASVKTAQVPGIVIAEKKSPKQAYKEALDLPKMVRDAYATALTRKPTQRKGSFIQNLALESKYVRPELKESLKKDGVGETKTYTPEEIKKEADQVEAITRVAVNSIFSYKLGSELATQTLKGTLTPQQLKVKLANGEITDPRGQVIAQKFIDANKPLVVDMSKPAGGVRKLLGEWVIGGKAKKGGDFTPVPENLSFPKNQGEIVPATTKAIVPTNTAPSVVNGFPTANPLLETIKPALINTAKVSNKIDPLIQEARKYKSADEFDADLARSGRDISPELKKLYPNKDYMDALTELVAGRFPKQPQDYSKGIRVFHGSDRVFKTIDPDKSNTSSKTGVGKGHVFYTTDKEVASSYGKNIIEDTIKPENPLIVDADGLDWADIKFEGKTYTLNDLAILAEKRGYGSLIVENVRDTGGKQSSGIPAGFKTSTTISIWKKANEIPKVENPTATSKVAKSIEAKTIEKGLSESFGNDLAGYTKTTIKEQSELAAQIINKDFDLAKKMVRGEAPLPEKLRGGTLIKAMEDLALEKGDAKLALDIAKSPLASETSRHAQELRMLAERNPDSAVAKLREVKQAREEALLKKHKGKSVAKVKKEETKKLKEAIEKNAPTKETWESFVESIKCT